MQVLEVVELSGPDGLRTGDRPSPSGDGVLVDVKAAALSFPDLLKSRGEYQDRAEVPYILGDEFSGVVSSAPSASGFHEGERVVGMARGGGAAAEQIVADPRSLFRLPSELSFEAGAGAIFNYETAIVALEFRGRLRTGETVLVHGAAGGTGTAALQVARAGGARTLALVSSAEKAEVAERAGADDVIVGLDGWKDKVLEHSDGRGVDIVFDPVGGERMLDTIRALRPGGRWLIIGFASGTVPQVPANRVLFRNIDVVGSFLGGWRRQGESARAQLHDRLRALLAEGHVQPVVGSVFDLEHGRDALRELDERRAQGKVVIRVR